MRTYEIRYSSVGSETYSKPVTALVMAPDRIGSDTGVMLATHGWGGNRFQHQDKMEYACEEFDLVCVAVEYRGSGHAFDPVAGAGWELPYDASFYQTFDVLNGLRTVLDTHPRLNRKRLIHYGGSQGGHIALLSAVFAPKTFAFVYAASPIVNLCLPEWAYLGRELLPHELSARNVLEHAGRIECPIFLEHGTNDDIVPHGKHTVPLAEKLEALGKQVAWKLYEGGDHALNPVTDRLDTFKTTAADALRNYASDGDDDLAADRIVEIPCADRTLRINWSRPTGSHELVTWV